MNNLEATIAVLAAHREARQWSDDAVAADLVAQLGLKPDGEAKNAKPVVMPGITEDEVVAHETAAKEAVAKAEAARAALKAQDDEAKAADKSDADKAAADRATAQQRPNPPNVPAQTAAQQRAADNHPAA